MSLERKVDLNEGFRVDYEARRVNREKVFAAWAILCERQHKNIPDVKSLEYMQFTADIRDKAQSLANQKKLQAATAYIYFATLLLLRNSIENDYTDLIVAHKAALRHLETISSEEQLTPKV